MSFVPIWFMLSSPSLWLIVLPFDFLVTVLMLWISNKVFRVASFRELFRTSAVKAWLVGFVGQIVGGLVLFISQGYFGEWWYEYITTPVVLNPLDNPYSLVFTMVGVAACGVFVFFLDRGFSFKNLAASAEGKRKLAVGLALLTLPMLYFLPSRMLYLPEAPVYNFTSHQVWGVQAACTVTAVAPADPALQAGEYTEAEARALAEAVNCAVPANASVSREAEFRLHFYDPELEDGRETDAELWFMDNGALFRVDGKFFLADEYLTDQTRAVLSGTYEPPVPVFSEESESE